MKIFLSVLILLSGLSGCSTSPSSQILSAEKLEKVRAHDELILSSLHSDPQKQGTKEVLKEAGITTEIWRSKSGHGHGGENIETLLYKNGKLISHSYRDGDSGFTGSQQFLDGKVIQYTEISDGKATVIHFATDENIKARLKYDGKNSECLVYENGQPQYEKFETCEAKFNTSP